MVNVRQLPYVIPDSMSPTGEESDEQTRAYRRVPAVGDSGSAAAAAGQSPRRALSAVRTHGAELLAGGLSRTGLREPGYGGIAVEGADRMLSDLAIKCHLEVSLEHGGLVYALMGERDATP